MKLLFLTGSRGEWGYIRPLLNLCVERGVDYHICVTNMHVLPAYGSSVQEIRKDGFEVEDELFMALDGYNHYTMAKSMGVLQISFVDVLQRVKPDWLILAGDRGETLTGAIAAGYTYTPVAHIQAGELSGNIDGQARHAIGKFAHLHFAANEDAAQRLRKLGEEEFRIHMVGAPQLDEMVNAEYASRAELERDFGILAEEPFLLVVTHPVTEDFEYSEEQTLTLIDSLGEFACRKVWVLPNNDAGGEKVRRMILENRKSDTLTFSNMPRKSYLGFLNACDCLVGNSSSGLLEAPTFHTPAVNIGRRQANRVRGDNVIDVETYEKSDIVQAIETARSQEFRASIADSPNPYGDGHSAERILDILEKTPVDDALIVKQLTY